MDSQQPRKQNVRRSRSVDGSREKGAKSKSSLGRKIANDAISREGGNMGASVYIADTITVNITFDF
jgi:hypothetical protein